METNNSIDLDLDALTTPPKRVKINGEIIEIFAPDVQSLFELMAVGNKLKSSKDVKEEDAQQVFSDFRAQIDKLIPALKGKSVSIDQLFRLIDLVSKMAIPNDLEEMEKRGITINSEQKKILSDSLEKSPDSSISTQDTPLVQS
jgi:DNA polymerase I-like protein with 3'-5' exonuclease and polymerase domains